MLRDLVPIKDSHHWAANKRTRTAAVCGVGPRRLHRLLLVIAAQPTPNEGVTLLEGRHGRSRCGTYLDRCPTQKEIEGLASIYMSGKARLHRRPSAYASLH